MIVEVLKSMWELIINYHGCENGTRIVASIKKPVDCSCV